MSETKNTKDEEKERARTTAEVGSEGGSQADRTHQVATHTGDVPRVEDAREQPPTGEIAQGVAPAPDDVEDGVHFARRPTSPRSETERG